MILLSEHGAQGIVFLPAEGEVQIGWKGRSISSQRGEQLTQFGFEIERRVLRPGDDYLVLAMENLAKLYEQDGRQEDARKLREEAAAFRSKYK